MKKRNVIKKYQEYQEILDLRKYRRNYLFTIYYRDSEFNYTRIGLLVGKRNGNAVTRNKIKRQVRAMIDEIINKDYLKSLDLIVVISKNYDIHEFNKNKEQLTNLFKDIYL